jgi:peptidoglycan/xylan/chitin deacetylase (PgdA/CDA1 family)
MATTFLMYHELELASRPLADPDPGYVRYCVTLESFRAQLDVLARRGLRGLSVSQWLDDATPSSPSAVITFDDGCETDLITATPMLRERGFNATCYLTVDFLGRRGFLTRAQARELAASGVEVGCHSMSHAFLSDIDDAALHREVVEAKDALEQLCGTRVRSFSCPGGRYDARLLPLATRAGYDSIATSRIGQNDHAHRGALLGRVAVLRDTSLSQFEAMIEGRGFAAQQRKERALAAAKAVLGNTVYERLRAVLLR